MIKFFFIIFIILYIYFKQIEKFSTYARCNNIILNKTYKNVFNKSDIQKTNIEEADFIFPCGYTNVEHELQLLNISNNKKIFGISGCDKIVSKDNLWFLLETKIGRNKTKKLMPETFLLKNYNHMNLFKKNYKEGNIYIMKNNLQRKKGLKLTKNYNEIITASNYRLVQEYINCYTINKRKLNIRIFIVIICKENQIKLFINKYGKCLYTNKNINNSLEPERNYTSLNLNTNIYNKNPLLYSELKNYQKIKKKIYNNVKQVISVVKPHLCKLQNIYHNTKFQLFGLDYIIDKNLNPYLLEINKGPDMDGKTPKDIKIKEIIVEDTLKLVSLMEKSNNNSFEEIIID